MTDIYVLYKQPNDYDEKISNYVQQIIEKVREINGSYVTKSVYSTDYLEKSKTEYNNSKVLLVFFENTLIYDDSCCKIWDYFITMQQSIKKQIIFPVELKQCTPGDAESKTKLDMLRMAKMYGFYLTYQDVNDQRSEIKMLASAISESIDPQKDIKETTNVVRVKEYIDEIFELPNELERQEKINRIITQAETEKKKSNSKNKFDKTVCAIYTGGTVGMIRKQERDLSAVLVSAKLDELVDNLPRLHSLDFNVHFYSYKNVVDSSNIVGKNWITLSDVIFSLRNVYDGFVIIHGANTMAYTAAALSFMLENLDKPVILTGSELPLTDLNSDAEQNVIRALDVAAHISYKINIPEVCILFGKRLIRGNRATKQIALDTAEGFYSPNFSDLASVTQDKVNIDISRLRVNENQKFINNGHMSTKAKIFIQDVYPDMDMHLFDILCNQSKLDALIIRTYGTGGAPDKNTNFIKSLKKLVDKGVIVINLTQCPIGSVELRLFETNAKLFDIGVINGGDMVTEAAYCKLKYLFSKYDREPDVERKKLSIINEMTVNLCGELTYSTFVIRFFKGENTGYNTVLSTNEWTESPDCSIVSDRNVNVRIPDQTPLYSVIIRIERLSVINGDIKEPLELEVQRYINQSHQKPLGIDRRMYETESNEEGIDINIDVTMNAKEAIELTKPFSLRVRSLRHTVEFKSLSVVISVQEG